MAGENKTFRVIVHIVMSLLSLACVLPFVLLLMASVTDDAVLATYGYSFFPKEFSLTAYQYLLSASDKILRAYGMTFLVTITGTAMNMFLTFSLGYMLSKRDLPGRGFFSFFIFFTMLFHGGMVASYIVWSNMIQIGDTVFALILPNLMLGAYSVILARTYFTTNIPEEIIEASRIDGCGEIGIMFRIVAPLSKPIMATLGLMAGLGYWNDWINGLYYVVRRPELYTIQNVLNTMMANAEFLTNNSNLAALREANLSVPTYGVRMGIAVIAVIPVLVVYPFFQKYFVKGIVIGGVKG